MEQIKYTYGWPLLVIFLFMNLVFALATIKKNNSIVDIFWGVGFAVTTIFLWQKHPHISITQIIVNVLVLIWAIRLSGHIAIKNWGQPEDWRYVNFRKAWGKHPFIGAYFQVFLLQGIFMFITLLPVIHVNTFFVPISHLTYFSIICWVIGFLFEAVGDYQKSVFKADVKNKGKIMTTGLWSLSRHPNYFGEALMWWGIWMISFSFFHPIASTVGILSPLILNWLLVNVSGVAMLEKKYTENEAYQAYKQSTPAFFPRLFRRK
ncbi:MAG: DUF1295 domain-containing protein [Chitinophagales bacterium]|nr:DUF1295 domain-containing protein [Chitinophagales bacterium]